MLSWIFSAVIILSVVLIGNKNRWGWMIANIGALGFIYLYIQTELWGGIALDLFLLVMNTRNFIKWSYNDRMHRPRRSNTLYVKFDKNIFNIKEVLRMDSSGNRYIVVKVDCKQTWWRKLWKKADITGCIKLKRYPSRWQQFKLRVRILYWNLFERDALYYFYPRTGDKTYLKLARLARIKIINLKKQLR